MLFVESRVAERGVERGARLGLLDALQARGLRPLLRSARVHFFEQALSDAGRAGELERDVAEWSDAEGDLPYVSGDVFCFDDFAHFLVFAEAETTAPSLRAGIVYTAETDEPAQKLEAFCRNVREAVEAAEGVRATGPVGASQFEWRARAGGDRTPAARFAGASADAAQTPSSPRGADARSRAAELVEDAAARSLLQRLGEARAEGRATEAHAAGHDTAQDEALVARLAAAGLVRREVQVSCRKDGRSLFRLPSSEALAMVTASNAVCSECGAAVADERAEELITPTPLADSMLRGGAWMSNGLRATLAEIGLPAQSIAARADDEEGEAQLLADVCGEPFLFVLRDGDFGPVHARRALEAEAETQATHLVVVAAGKISDEARARLREHARRRSRAGGEAEAIFVEGLDRAAEELRPAFERVASEALTRELYELDAAAGFSVGHMLAARFRLLRRTGALKDLAASAAGALAGSLKEF